MKYTYALELVNSRVIEIDVEAESPLARDTFIKDILENKNRDKFIVDNITKQPYNKEYVITYKVKDS